MVQSLTIESCLKLFTDEQKREMKHILDSIYKSVTIHEFNSGIESREPGYNFICYYNYKTDEELGKKMVNDARHYIENKGFFHNNSLLYDLWKEQYEFEDKEIQEFIDQLDYRIIEMDTVKKIYDEIGYDELVDHLKMINKIDHYEDPFYYCCDECTPPNSAPICLYVIDFSDSPPNGTELKN